MLSSKDEELVPQETSGSCVVMAEGLKPPVFKWCKSIFLEKGNKKYWCLNSTKYSDFEKRACDGEALGCKLKKTEKQFAAAR